MAPPAGRGDDARIDAAVDHFAAMGYAARAVRSAVEALLEEHGGPAAWPFLEEGSYKAVQDRLLEEEEEEVELLLLQEGAQEPQLPEAATANEASPEHGMQISQVHSEPPAQTISLLEKSRLLDSPNKSPVHKVLLPFRTATSTARLRPPTYGWISTESESESESDNGEISSDVPNPAESFLSKRKRPSRWDEHPKW